MKKITTPLSEDVAKSLRAGERVLITGEICAARDAAHGRFLAALREGKPLPLDLRGQILYYVGPSPAPPGKPIGSAGPTTSSRMDPLTPPLLETGLKGMIGKGPRSAQLREALAKYAAVYFVATGGAGALLAASIQKAEIIAYPELGAEAVWKLTVRDFPAIVAYDARGGDAFQEGQQKYRQVRAKEGDECN